MCASELTFHGECCEILQQRLRNPSTIGKKTRPMNKKEAVLSLSLSKTLITHTEQLGVELICARKEMKVLFGSPGRVSGLVLRTGQCLFGAASIGVMASASGFSSATAFCYLIAAMGLQVVWSFGLACLDIHALRLKKDLHNHILVSLFVVGDWVTAILSLAAACSSAGVMVLFVKDSNICEAESVLSCSMFQVSIALAFFSWFLLAISSYIMFWLLASL